jgi:formylglycine-generating enzyme required for sulfatase activity
MNRFYWHAPSQQNERSRLRVASVLTLALICAAVSGPARAAGKYALVIGVEHYIPDQLSQLNYAEDDAVALGEALGKLGFEVITMTSQAENPLHKPSNAKKIETQIRERLDGRNASDTVVLALSGHGVEFQDEDAESWFCPEEAVLSDRTTLLPMSGVLAAMGACGAGKKLLLVDACRDKFLPKGGGKGVNVVDTGSSGPKRLPASAGTLALFACRSGERSFELADLGHGVFTSYVVDYLSGKASKELYDNGQANVKGLDAFVSSSTRERVSQVFASSQRPVSIQPAGELDNWSLGGVQLLPKPGEVVENSIGMKLVMIPAGEFLIGSDETKASLRRDLTAAGIDVDETFSNSDERPVHKVQITKPFLMGQTEVTLGQFLQFYHDGYKGRLDCEIDGKGGFGYDAEEGFKQDEKYRPWSWGFDGQTNDHPVVNVSWNDCVAFCEWLSRKEKKPYRLPTEAEWEYACRAGTSTRYWFGEDFEKLADCENVGDQTAKGFFKLWGYHILSRDGFAFTAPVGAKRRANPFGLYDMHGNVAEWCSDWYGDYEVGTVRDPKGAALGSERVFRGGGWSWPASYCRSANRSKVNPSNLDDHVGFRLALSLSGASSPEASE